jgi:signal transduction histidine kinase
MFGSIGITLSGNPNLRDKAGREGLIDNKHAKVFRQLVENILVESARNYFGSAFVERKKIISGIRERNTRRRALEEQRKLAKKRRDEFRKRVRDQRSDLQACLSKLEGAREDWHKDKSKLSEATLVARRNFLSTVQHQLYALDVGEMPAGLQALQAEYDEYADNYEKTSAIVDLMAKAVFEQFDKLAESKATDIFETERSKRQRELESVIAAFQISAKGVQGESAKNLEEIGRQQVSTYVATINSIYREVMEGRLAISAALRGLDERFAIARREAEDLFVGVISTLEALRDNIDVSVVATSGLDDISQLREELSKVNNLAQLGITVEIIGHELESLDAAVSHGLSAFPREVQELRAYKTVVQAHNSLTDRLRFLSPLKLSGEQQREWISGKDIYDYIKEFFSTAFEREHIQFPFSDAFANFRVYDRRSRILPVFVNLVNNSRYWIAQKANGGKIEFGIRQNKIVIADDGPGIAQRDVKFLFTLFFSRKPRGGRGVGLYLCRTNLAAGGHKIWYAEEEGEKLASGANFVLEFLGAEFD